MGADKSTLSKFCTCSSKNDYIENSNLQRFKSRNCNMSARLSPDSDTNGVENSISAFGYDSTPCPCPIPLDYKTIDLLIPVDNTDTIPAQKKSSQTLSIVNHTEETEEKIFTDINVQKRIQKISNAGDITQLKKIIHEHYSVIHSNQSSYQSSFPLKPNNDSKANIYRDGTNTPWTDQDIEELTFEMHQQLHNLINNNIIMDFESDNIVIVSDDEDIPSSNLYRNKSKEKWSKKTIDIQRNQMKKEILHLALSESNESVKTKR
eukprot:373707_1